MTVKPITWGASPSTSALRILIGKRPAEPPPSEVSGLVNADVINIVNADGTQLTNASGVGR